LDYGVVMGLLVQFRFLPPLVSRVCCYPNLLAGIAPPGQEGVSGTKKKTR